ncbi:MAG: hypothetical protein QW774_02835 [Candidatus Micrarchaeaceae archaeon]
MKRLILLSLDMLMALQLILIAALMLYKTYYILQRNIAETLYYQTKFLNVSDLSQEFVTAIESTQMNFSTASSFISSESRVYNLNVSLLKGYTLRNATYYCQYSLCRLVTSDNITYLMVVNYEASNES